MLTRPNTPALYAISVRRPAVLPRASFRPHLAVTPLPLASSSSVMSLDSTSDPPAGDSHPISSCPCWAYTQAGRKARTWDLAKDVVDTVQAGNPHADSLGNAGVWSFYTIRSVPSARNV